MDFVCCLLISADPAYSLTVCVISNLEFHIFINYTQMLCVCVCVCRCELTHSKYVDKLPAGKHSTKGLGRTAPTTDGHKTTEEGVVIPMGKGSSTAVDNTSLLYNEYPIQCQCVGVRVGVCGCVCVCCVGC